MSFIFYLFPHQIIIDEKDRIHMIWGEKRYDKAVSDDFESFYSEYMNTPMKLFYMSFNKDYLGKSFRIEEEIGKEMEDEIIYSIPLFSNFDSRNNYYILSI